VQIKALGVGAAYIQVSDLRAIMALLFLFLDVYYFMINVHVLVLE
jgi:hypothetical protein